jgi:hypothetical protein
MTFTLQVRFFGLCHFVKNSNSGGVGMCVVLPEAGASHISQLAVVEGGLTTVANNTPVTSPISLAKELVDFQLGGGKTADPFQFNSPVGGVQAMIDFSQLLQQNVTFVTDPNIVRPAPPAIPATVRAQALLRGGTLGPDVPSGTYDWKLPKSDFKSADEQVTVAAKSIWSIEVDTAALTVAPFGGQAVAYSMSPAASNKCIIEISNECILSGTTIDLDFRHHYELLDSATRASIVAKIGSLDNLDPALPIRLSPPQAALRNFHRSVDLLGSVAEVQRLVGELERINRKFTSGGNPTGCNCLGCRGADAAIQFP